MFENFNEGQKNENTEIDPRMELLVKQIMDKQTELKTLESDARFSDEAKQGLRSTLEGELLALMNEKVTLLDQINNEASPKNLEAYAKEGDLYSPTSKEGSRGERDFR